MTVELARRLEDMAAEVAAVLRRLDRPRDWIDEALDAGGDGLKSDEAGHIMGRHADTARRWAEEAAETDKPIAIQIAGSIWLFSLHRLLDAIEEKEGLPARLAAETRARKNAQIRALSVRSA